MANDDKLFRIENDIARADVDEPDHYLADDSLESIYYEKAMEDFGATLNEDRAPDALRESYSHSWQNANTREYPKAYLEAVCSRRRARADESDISQGGELLDPRYALSNLSKRRC